MHSTPFRYVVLLGLPALIRVFYFSDYVTNLPFIYGPIADSRIYLEQARDLLAGRFSSPALVAFSPLYGYFLTATFAHLTKLIPVVVQFALGCVNALLLFRMVSKRFGNVPAYISYGLYLSYGTFLYFESKILSETLGFTLALLAMNAYLSPEFEKGKIRTGLAAGLFVALAVLARASLVFSAPFFVVAALVRWNGSDICFGQRAVRTAALVVGMSLVFGANGLWNKVHCGYFVPVIMVSRTVASESGRRVSDKLVKSGGGSAGAAASDVVEQAKERIERRRAGLPEPEWASGTGGIDWRGWLRNAPSKILKTFTNREISFQYGFLGEKENVRILLLLPGTFGVIALLGILGCFANGRQFGLRAVVPFLPLILGTIVTTTLYYPTTRYRFGMVIPFLLMGGYGVYWLLGIENRTGRYVAALVMSGAVLALSVHGVTRRLTNFPEWYIQIAQSHHAAGQDRQALEKLEMAVVASGNDPGVLGRAARLRHAIFLRAHAKNREGEKGEGL